MRREDLPLYHLSFFLSEPKEIPPHFQTDPPAYLMCLSCSAGEEEVSKKKKSMNGIDQNYFLKQIFICYF